MKGKILAWTTLTLLLIAVFVWKNVALLESVSAQQDSSDPVTHFMNPPTFDSGWVDIRDKLGKSFTLTHSLGTTDVFVDIVGRRKPTSADHKLFFGSTIHIPGWNETYGEIGNQPSMCQTSDGGYALVSTVLDSNDRHDFRLIKTHENGTKLWEKTYGRADCDEVATSVIQTADGGYAMAGWNTSIFTGLPSACLVKTKLDGSINWSQTYAPYAGQGAYSVIQTMDGGYALIGLAAGIPITGFDMLLITTNPSGTMLGSYTYGGPNVEVGRCLVQTSDGGFAIAGYTTSYGSGMSDFWLVKTLSYGALDWNHTYGGPNTDGATSVIQTEDGGYAIVGTTKSYGAGDNDFWLVRTNDKGTHLWNRTYGGTLDDTAYSFVQTDDGGYALAGYTCSFSMTIPPDIWLVKTNPVGDEQWNETYGGTDYDMAYSVVQASDGTYVMACQTTSLTSDLTLIKTDMTYGSSVGLSMIDLTDSTITLYRGEMDPYWNYIRVRIWKIEEPAWQYGDINMDGHVDDGDLFILARNYWKTYLLYPSQIQTTANVSAAATVLLAVAATPSVIRWLHKNKNHGKSDGQ